MGRRVREVQTEYAGNELGQNYKWLFERVLNCSTFSWEVKEREEIMEGEGRKKGGKRRQERGGCWVSGSKFIALLLSYKAPSSPMFIYVTLTYYFKNYWTCSISTTAMIYGLDSATVFDSITVSSLSCSSHAINFGRGHQLMTGQILPGFGTFLLTCIHL